LFAFVVLMLTEPAFVALGRWPFLDGLLYQLQYLGRLPDNLVRDKVPYDGGLHTWAVIYSLWMYILVSMIIGVSAELTSSVMDEDVQSVTTLEQRLNHFSISGLWRYTSARGRHDIAKEKAMRGKVQELQVRTSKA